MAVQFAFVAVDAYGKARKSDNVIVRSHCMRGRNKRESSRRSRRQAQQQASAISATCQEGIEEGRNGGHESRDEPLVLLRAPMTGLEAVQFATKVDDCSKEIFFKYKSYSMEVQTLYPLEHHLAYHKDDDYFYWLASDVGFVHSVLLSVSAINDLVAKHTRPSVLTRVHLRNTLHYLSARLSEAHGYTLDSIITVVLTLGHSAALFEDFDAAAVHLKGLAQIVGLRGGTDWLEKFPKYHFKFDRLDLTWCLSTGKSPLFFPRPVSWSPFFRGAHPIPSPTTPLHSSAGHPLPVLLAFHTTSSELLLSAITTDLYYLASLVNTSASTNTSLSIALFHNAIHSTQSRLLALQNEAPLGALPECLRLGLLAFLTTTFRVPGRKMPHVYFTQRLRVNLQLVRPKTPEERGVVFWALLMSLINVFEEDEEWMLTLWRSLVAKAWGWEDARRWLKGFIWIDSLHDEEGRVMFMQWKAKASREALQKRGE